MMNNQHSHRLTQLQTYIKPHQAWMLSTASDITYFTGFEMLVPAEREALLVVTSQQAYLLHASFSPYQPQEAVTPIKGCHPQIIQQTLVKLHKKDGINEILVDDSSLFLYEYQVVNHITDLVVDSFNRQAIWNIRTIKDGQEVDYLRRAAQITATVMKDIISQLKSGLSEQDVKRMIDNQLRDLTDEQPAFPTIVAFGAHAALPHHQPTTTPLQENTPVLLDFGGRYHHYCADMTRTIWFGSHPSSLFTNIESIIAQAYQAALTTINQGLTHSPNSEMVLTAQTIDGAAREMIDQAGYGETFIHTTGHGVGLDIHESLSLSWNNTQRIQPGMSITIEPGIYLEGQFGYRHENTIYLTEQGVEELTTSEK